MEKFLFSLSGLPHSLQTGKLSIGVWSAREQRACVLFGVYRKPRKSFVMVRAAANTYRPYRYPHQDSKVSSL